MAAVARARIISVDSIMTDSTAVEKQWTQTAGRCMSQLKSSSGAEAVDVDSLEQLMGTVQQLQSRYKERRITMVLTRIGPFLDSINSLVHIIDTFVQGCPDVAAVCWGSIKLVLELAVQAKNMLEQVSNGLSEIGKILPRLEAYRVHLPLTPQLNTALVVVYQEVVGFFLELIRVLRQHPARHLFTSLWRGYDKSFRKRINQIQDQSRDVESEARIAKLIVDETRHNEIKHLIMVGPDKPGVSATLPCYVIPFGRNTHFFGRAAEIQECKDGIDMNRSSTESRPKIVLLHGYGGVGKTSVALQLAHDEKSRRQIVLWMAAEDGAKLSISFVRAAASLGLHEENSNPEADRSAVIQFLEKTATPWLIVFDNVEHFKGLQDCIPQSGINGACVITSRNPDLGQTLNASSSIRISSFSPDEGAEYLVTNVIGSGEYVTAKALSTYLGGLPLGLKQLGGFIRETGCTIESILQSLHDKVNEKQLLNDPDTDLGLEYSRNLATAWSHSLDALDETARRILLFCAMADPDNISETIMSSLKDACCQGLFPNVFTTTPTPVEYLQSLRSLIRFGLIEKMQERDCYSIHRLVQTIVLQDSDQDTRMKTFNALIDLYLQKHPQSQATSNTLFAYWDICAVYAPHILRLHALIKHWKLQPDSHEKIWILSFNCARYLLETGAMAMSLDLTLDTQQFCDLSTREGELQMTYLHNNQGLIDLQHNRQADARKWFEAAEAVRKKYLGGSDVNTVAVQGNLALTLINERKWAELVAFNESRNEAIKGNMDIPARLRSAVYDLLSLAYLETGQLDKALAAIDESASINSETLLLYSQLSGYIHFNRGKIQAARGELDDAIHEMFLSFRIRKKVLGDHIQTAASCYHSAVFFSEQGKRDDATTLFKESKRMYGSLGLIGGFTRGGEARSSWRLGMLSEEEGKLQEAETYYKEARDGLRALGRPADGVLDEQTFSILLNYVDS